MKMIPSMFLGVVVLCAASHANEAAEPVTFAKDVAPIFQNSCQECHKPGDIAPMSLRTYEEIRPWAKSIRNAVSNRVMPPFHAEHSDYEFANDIRLSEVEIDTIVRWVDQGARLGNPSDLPPVRETKSTGWRAGEPDLVLMPDAPYVVPAGVNDEYRCFVLRTHLPQDTWVSGIEYRPGNPRVVHHIMAYAEPSGRAHEKDVATPEPGFSCGMSGDQSTLRLDLLLGGWAPGTPPNMFGEGIGRLLPANTDIVFQVHYHNETGEDQPDQSAMGIHFARSPIRQTGRISLVGAFQLKIPAGEANAQHRGFWVAPYDILLGSVMPHMHYIGKDMTVTATFPDGKSALLVDVPRYDFNWQMVYEYAEPVLIPQGTRIEMVSHHDNSASNPANPFDPPRDMYWGEATDEEMAHAWLGFVKADEDLNITPTPPDLNAIRAARIEASSGGH